MRAALACLVLVMPLLVVPNPSGAQMDLAAVLVGKWEGQADLKRDSPPRTLIIKSVQQRDGRWVAQGRFGDPEKRLHPVEIAIETSNHEVVLKFTEPGRTARPVELTLFKDGKHLIGSLWRHAGRVRGETDPLRLEKVE
jgi:hypothetical protein